MNDYTAIAKLLRKRGLRQEKSSLFQSDPRNINIELNDYRTNVETNVYRKTSHKM